MQRDTYLAFPPLGPSMLAFRNQQEFLRELPAERPVARDFTFHLVARKKDVSNQMQTSDSNGVRLARPTHHAVVIGTITD